MNRIRGLQAAFKGQRMELGKLIEGLDVRLVTGAATARVTGLTDDSRRVRPGDLFIARAGRATDGRRFVDDAVTRGAVGVVEGGGAFEVARRFFGDPGAKLMLVGITGTN